MDFAKLSSRHSPEAKEVRQILLHACQLCRSLDAQLLMSSDSAAQFISHLPLIHQVVESFRNGIKLLHDFIPDVQQLPSVVSNSLVQSPPNMNRSLVPIVETVNCKSELLTPQASALEEHVMPMILEPSVPMKVPVTTSKLRTPGEKHCMKNHVGRAIYKERNVKNKSKPRMHERQNIASCPCNSTNDIANNSLETEGVDSLRNDQQHPIKPIRALKNSKKGTRLPSKTVRLQGDQMDQLNDPYTWRKYGQKSINGANNPRSYYRCSHKDDIDCPAKKRVQKCDDQACAFDVTYVGNHTCELVQLENQLTGGSINLPDLFPKNHVLVSLTCFQSSASAVDSSDADLYHQFGLESPRMHSMSPGERTQDTNGSLAASSSISAQPIVSDFSFSSSNDWSLHVNEKLTSLLPKTREISSKQDGTAWDYSKPPQQYQDHASSSMESTERPFTGLGRPYTSSRDNSLLRQGSISPATPEISSHQAEIVTGSLREQFSQYAEPEATDFLPISVNSEYDFLDDYILFDIED